MSMHRAPHEEGALGVWAAFGAFASLGEYLWQRLSVAARMIARRYRDLSEHGRNALVRSQSGV